MNQPPTCECSSQHFEVSLFIEHFWFSLISNKINFYRFLRLVKYTFTVLMDKLRKLNFLANYLKMKKLQKNKGYKEKTQNF